MSTILRMCAVAVTATALLVSRASASLLLDPTTLHIGPGAGTACATGGCPIFSGGLLNGEVNNIGPTELDIYQNSNGAPALDNPVLLILATPNNATPPSPLSASLYNPYPETSPGPTNPTSVPISAGADAYNITTGTSGPPGFFGLMTSSDVYSVLGIQGATKSNSFTNYSAAYLRTFGTPVSSFGLYVFSIDTYNFGSNDLLDIQFGSSLPEGTFAVAYGQDPQPNPQHFYVTPFTEAGMSDQPPMPPIPEPPTLAVFGAALVALGLMRWRKRSFN